MATKDDVISVLRKCYDPEIPINIYDLGLVYNIDLSPGDLGPAVDARDDVRDGEEAVRMGHLIRRRIGRPHKSQILIFSRPYPAASGFWGGRSA